jgi:zinc/manganese transport system substrate-binding protein
MISKSQRLLLGLAVILVGLSHVDAQVTHRQERTRTRLGRSVTGDQIPAKPLHVVTTLPDYAALAKIIGGQRITTESIVHPIQDPHHIRPKPSFIHMVKRADVLIATGLDLEMWLPTVVNKSGNRRIRSGEIGFVAVTHGMALLEKPSVVSQIEGDVHIQGNPHVMCSPIKARQAVYNIATGLIKNDPAGKTLYEANRDKLARELAEHLFGAELVTMLGADTLCRLAEQHKLISFLQDKTLKGRPLIERLQGWMGRLLPLRGQPIVVYHKNWSYFIDLFGLEEVATIESKPGIPPSPKHVTGLVTMMRERNIKLILAANYFDQQKVQTVATKTGARAVVSPLFVGGTEETQDYATLVDSWVTKLVRAARDTGIIEEP